jgi:hypothetical protein
MSELERKLSFESKPTMHRWVDNIEMNLEGLW